MIRGLLILNSSYSGARDLWWPLDRLGTKGYTVYRAFDAPYNWVKISGPSPTDTMKAARSTNMVWSGYNTVDWSGCDEVEQVEGKLSGVPVLKDTRMQADLVIDNYQAGLSADEIAEVYRLDPRQVKAVIDYSLSHQRGFAVKILFDNNVPYPLAHELDTHDVKTARQMGWDKRQG
jgi:uncharacterized protein (DUF433 family)